jgi:hypothetical protein
MALTWRFFISLVLFLSGLALVGLSVLAHPIELTATREVKVEKSIPDEPKGPGGALPFFMEQAPPPPPENETRTEIESIVRPEPQIIVEVTRGGIERTADGQLRLTYSGKPPSFCPT